MKNEYESLPLLQVTTTEAPFDPKHGMTLQAGQQLEVWASKGSGLTFSVAVHGEKAAYETAL